jgi:hypothetical protein
MSSQVVAWQWFPTIEILLLSNLYCCQLAIISQLMSATDSQVTMNQLVSLLYSLSMDCIENIIANSAVE